MPQRNPHGQISFGHTIPLNQRAALTLQEAHEVDLPYFHFAGKP